MNLKKVYQKCVKKVISLPNLFIDMIYAYSRKKIKENVGFDTDKVKPKDVSDQIRCPIVMLGSPDDDLVEFVDMKKLFNRFDKNRSIFIECKGNHNSCRNPDILFDIFELIGKEKVGSLNGIGARTVTTKNENLDNGISGHSKLKLGKILNADQFNCGDNTYNDNGTLNSAENRKISGLIKNGDKNLQHKFINDKGKEKLGSNY